MHDAPRYAPDWLHELNPDATLEDHRWDAQDEDQPCELACALDGSQSCELIIRAPGRIPRVFSLARSRPFQVQLSRSHTSRGLSVIERAVGRTLPREHHLHLELRQGPERVSFRATVPDDAADTWLEGLPWMERDGPTLALDDLTELTTGLLAEDTAALARWDRDATREPKRRLVAEEPEPEPEPSPSSTRPQLSTWAIMRHDLRHVLAFYIFALIGMGFFLWLPLIAYTQNEWRYEQGQDVEGEVISLRSTEDGRRIGYRFVDEQGDVHEGSDTMEGPRATQYHQGDRISIEYLTETPSKNRIYNVAKVGLTGGYVFLGLLGLLTLAFPIRPVIQAGLRARRARTLYRAGVRVEGEVVAHRDTRYAFERRALKRLWIRCRHGGRASRVLACPVVDPEDYPVGTPITVFVDPRDPERFTWERPLKAPRAEPRELV